MMLLDSEYVGYEGFEAFVMGLSLSELGQLFELACGDPYEWPLNPERRPIATRVAIGTALALRPNETFGLLKARMEVPEARSVLLEALSHVVYSESYSFDQRFEEVLWRCAEPDRHLSWGSIYTLIICAAGLEESHAEAFIRTLEQGSYGQLSMVKLATEEARYLLKMKRAGG